MTFAKSVRQKLLFLKLVGFVVSFAWDSLQRATARQIRSIRRAIQGRIDIKEDEIRNVIVIGASFAGYHAARLIAQALPLSGQYRVVVVEPNSHFQFSWVLPRFCVAPGHEHKAFIPYGPGIRNIPSRDLLWKQDLVTAIDRKAVYLQKGEPIPYEYCVVATGSGFGMQLPSRVGATSKASGQAKLQDMQSSIRSASKIVVVGGGAAGIELAMDIKGLYPETKVTLVHSRTAVMNRFGPELQKTAHEWLQKLGVEVMLGQRTKESNSASVTLSSGRILECDLLINCTGQKPSSELLKELTSKTIKSDGHVKVKPTLQIDDTALPNIYACGDITSVGVSNQNARLAMRQATIVADNILCCLNGKSPSYTFEPRWSDGAIKLTLGLENSVANLGDGEDELQLFMKEKNLALMCAGAWRHLGAKAFEDHEDPTATIVLES